MPPPLGMLPPAGDPRVPTLTATAAAAAAAADAAAACFRNTKRQKNCSQGLQKTTEFDPEMHKKRFLSKVDCCNTLLAIFPTTLAVLGILSSCPRVMTMQCWKSQIPPPLSTRLRIVIVGLARPRPGHGHEPRLRHHNDDGCTNPLVAQILWLHKRKVTENHRKI